MHVECLAQNLACDINTGYHYDLLVLWFLYLHCIVLGGTEQAGLKSLVKNICLVAAFTPHLAINVLTPTQLQLG